MTTTAAPAVQVSGGAAGTMADVESVRALSTTVDSLGTGLAGDAVRTAALGSHPALVLTGALDPVGAVRVYERLAASTAGLTASAGVAAGYSTGLAAAATTYLLADTEVSDVVHAVWSSLGFAAAAPAFAAAVGAAAAWGTGRLITESIAEAPDVVRGISAGDDPLTVLRESGDDALDATGDVLADDGAALVEWLVRHPDVAREALATLPMLVPMLPIDPQGVGHGPGQQGVGAAGFTALLLAAGRQAGQFVDGRVDITKVQMLNRPGPAGVSDLLRRSARLTAPRGSLQGYTELKGGAVVDRLPPTTAGGKPRWVVYLAPTNDWGTTGGPYASDLTSNLDLVAKQGMRPGGKDPDAVEGAVKAMRRAGIQPGEKVMLVGFSQGGITAATLASDPALRAQFDVEGMLTAGAPISEFDVPREVQVLSLEHDSDLIPELDGSVNPDRPNWTTVDQPDLDPEIGNPAIAATVDTADSLDELFAGHYLDGYVDLGAQLDDSSDPSVVAWRESMAEFLVPEQQVSTTEVTVRRRQ